MRRSEIFAPFYKDILKQENGVVLVVTLMIMVVLTIMGAAAITIRNTEQSITLNSEVFQNNFYTAEAVVLEGAAEIENLTDAVLWDDSAFPGWLKLQQDPPVIDLRQSSQWPSALIIPAETAFNSGVTDMTPPGYASDGTVNGDRIWYAAMDTGICGGDLTDPTKRENCYEIYGMYDIKQGTGKTYHGKKMLKVGYKKVIYEP